MNGLTFNNSFPTVAPTIQRLTSTGATTGALFQVTTGASAALGAVYGNNGSTYLISTAFLGAGSTYLFTGGAGFGAALSGATLLLLSGAGSSGIGFTNPITLATYTTPTQPSSPLYLRIKICGGGGGGGAGGSKTLIGANGGFSFFGVSLLVANGGGGGDYASGFSTGGTVSFGSTTALAIVRADTGGGGQGSDGPNVTNGLGSGGQGGSNAFGGPGAGAGYTAPGSTAILNTGGGGGGGGSTSGGIGGAGGAAGGYIDAILKAPGATYFYAVGAGGTGGTGGNQAGAGGTGVVIVEEMNQ